MDTLILPKRPRSTAPVSAPTLRGKYHDAFVDGFLDASDDVHKALMPLLDQADLDPAALYPLSQFGGQYALVLEGRRSGHVHLITDLIGSRPIYYAKCADVWRWSFRLKDLLQHFDTVTPDVSGLNEMFCYRWLMEEHTLLAGVSQVVPGQCVTLAPGAEPLKTRQARFAFNPAQTNASEDDLIAQTDAALDGYFSKLRQRKSRIAVFFSGGVDSTLLLAKAKAQNFDTLLAMTGRYPGHKNPELERAQKIAAHLGVQHKIIDVPDSYVAEHFGEVVTALERPSTYFNSITRKRIFEHIPADIDVILSGEGADCVFGSDELVGLSKFAAKQKVIGLLAWPLRRALVRALRPLQNGVALRLSKLLAYDEVSFARKGSSDDFSKKPGDITLRDLIPALRTARFDADTLYAGYEPQNATSLFAMAQNRTFYTSNRNQLFVYTALAAQSNIEVGFPFISRELLDVAATLPDRLKMDGKGAKPILKKLACRYIPSDWVYASKYGFRSPSVDWLDGALAPHHQMVLDDRTRARGIFDMAVLRRLTPQAHKSLLITAISLETFFRTFID